MSSENRKASQVGYSGAKFDHSSNYDPDLTKSLIDDFPPRP
jgi:hypothetical protein